MRGGAAGALRRGPQYGIPPGHRMRLTRRGAGVSIRRPVSTPFLPWDDDVPATSPAHASAPAQGDARVRLVCSAAAAERLALVHETLSVSAVADWLVLAASHTVADEVVRDACVGLGAVAGRHRMGIAELALRLATPRLAAVGATPTSPLGFEAVVARALGVLRASGQLGRLAAADEHPGFLGALAATLLEVRLAGLPAADLTGCGALGPDLARCAHEVDKALTELGQADRALLLRWALDALEAGASPLPTRPDVPLVVVDPPCTSRLDTAFVAAVVERASHALVVGPAGDPGFEALASLLGVAIEGLDAASARPAMLSRAQQRLFVPAEESAPTSAADDGSVELFSAPGEGRECVEVARRLVAAAAAGMPYDQMAVVLRAPHTYASHLETALRRAEVPAWFSRGSRRPDPSGRALLALLACARDDLSARRFAEYLSLGQVPAVGPPAEVVESAAQEPPRRSPWRWEALLNEAAVIGGLDRWRRRLDGFRQELLTRADAVAVDEPESPRADALRRRAALVEELLDFAMPLLEGMATWRVDLTSWRAWLERLAWLARAALAHPEHVLEVLAELQPMAEVGDIGLEEVSDVLRERLTHVAVPPPDDRYGHVFVGAPDDLRGRAFRLVCVPGLSERVFPQRSRQDPLLLDAARLALSPWLPTDDRRVADERLRLRLAVGAATEQLVTSFASFDAAQSRPRVPSFYALDIQRACGGRLPGYEQILRAAQRASGARLAWPAPADALHAVDRLEHDLSVLQRHLRGAEEDVRGRARYLFHGHPSLRRSLIMRHDRTRRVWTPSDGLVADAASAASIASSLSRHRLHARAYSVSALQRFAVCPYQFHLSTIVRLAPRDEAAPMTSMDPLTRGSMVHQMLAEAMRAFEANGWVPLSEAHLPEALATADRIVEDVAQRHRDRLVPPIDRIWLDEVQAIRRDMREWVRRLPDDQRGWTPAYVELGFGFGRGDGRDASSVREDVVLDHGWRLHGVIDLVEQGPDDTWRITDYKTGRNRLQESVLINKGETLQPALYALALERALGGRVVSSRLWFCTTDGGYAQRDVPVDVQRQGQARERALEVLAAVDRAVEVGFLPAAPKEDACTWCDFAAVCGPDAQQRTRGKARAPLGDLLLIRSQR
jgi:ATP-dependent helicase/nuclease subunit B